MGVKICDLLTLHYTVAGSHPLSLDTSTTTCSRFGYIFFPSAFHETLMHLTGATIIIRQIAERYFGKVNSVAYRRSVNKLQISAEGAFHCTQNLSDASPRVPSALLLLQQITQQLSDSRAAITRPADDRNAKPAEGCAWENGVYHRSKP